MESGKLGHQGLRVACTTLNPLSTPAAVPDRAKITMAPAATESHRIYWQQWISAKSGLDSNEPRLSRRELITSSAAVRLSPAAKTRDVTALLRQTMQISADEYSAEDSLVIVGTLYSLPRGYVRFQEDAESKDEDMSYPNRDPFHVVKTIAPDESPLKMKETMQRYLDEQLARAIAQSTEPQRSIISPKSQFYFIPSPNLTTMQVVIPNCVELDGYATDMESKPLVENWTIDAPVKLQREPSDLDIVATLAQQYPWLAANEQDIQPLTKHETFREQEALAAELKFSRQIHSGFLLKRSQSDPNVWRQVYCAITPTDLWYTSRRYTTTQYHGRIRLTRALLLQPSNDYLPLLKTPYAWEMVGNDGRSHWFRASCKQSQQQWMRTISECIVNAYEASLMDNAESWVTDEAKARSQRTVSLLLTPFQQDKSLHFSDPHVSSVLRWGLELSDYRETCRKLSTQQEALEPSTLRDIWAFTEELWFQATKLVQLHNDRPHSHADTLCQHIDFMITGRRRRSGEATFPTNSHSRLKHDSCPPIDLFDHLLAELQKLASSCAFKSNK